MVTARYTAKLYCVEEDGEFIAESGEIDDLGVGVLGVGKTKEEAVRSLVFAVRNALDEHSRDPNIKLADRNSHEFETLGNTIPRVAFPDITRHIQGYNAVVDIFDLTET